MKKKNIFFPILGCLSGAAGVASGFVLSCSVKDTVSALTSKVAIDNAGSSYDFYSYFFGNTQTVSVDDTALMTAKLVELCGKGFGLLLIFIGLFTVCYFGSKIEKALRAPDFPPPFVPAPEEYSAPVQNYTTAEDYTAPAEGVYPPAGEYNVPSDENYTPENSFQNTVNEDYSGQENNIP